MTVFAFVLIAILVFIDQIIKIWVSNNLILKQSVEFIHFGDLQVLNLSYIQNTGAAFSILEGKTAFLSIFSGIVIVIGILAILLKKIKQPLVVISVSLMIAGGLGNLIDRVFRHYVIDYLEFKLFNFAVFNFADCCVVIGVILLAVYLIFLDKPKTKGKEVINEKL